MLLFGSSEKPFSPDYIDEDYLYIKKLFSKKINTHLVDLLTYLNSTSENEWKISDIENIDTNADINDQRKVINKELIYKNFKTIMVDTRAATKESITSLIDLKTLLLINNEIESKQRDLNYSRFAC